MWGMVIGKPKASDCVFTISGERLYYYLCGAHTITAAYAADIILYIIIYLRVQ